MFSSADLLRSLELPGTTQTAIDGSSSSSSRSCVEGNDIGNSYINSIGIDEETELEADAGASSGSSGSNSSSSASNTAAHQNTARRQQQRCSDTFYDTLSTSFKSTLEATSNHLTAKLSQAKILLVIAGGYDDNVTENREYLIELQRDAARLGLSYSPGSNIGGDITTSDPTSSSAGGSTSASSHDHNTVGVHGSSGNSSSSSSCDVAGECVASGAVDIVFRQSISSRERTSLLRTATGRKRRNNISIIIPIASTVL